MAEIAMKSCVARRLSVIDSRTNGPSLCAVFQTVIEQTTRIAVAAPRGPSAAPPTRAPETRCRALLVAGAICQHHEQCEHDCPRRGAAGGCPSSRTWPRQEGGRSDQDAGRSPASMCERRAEVVGGDHVAEVQRHWPEGGADDGGEERARDEGQHVEHAFELATPAGQAAQNQGRDHERQRVPHRLAEDGSERRRVIPEQEIADHNAGPEPNAIEKQHGKSNPAGGHRAATAPSR